MCTVTWLGTEGGYELLSNRDERRTRPPAAPPSLRVSGGVRYLAPVDAEAGGSWLTANELGVTLCLLNLYEAPLAGASPAAGGSRSRGLLVTDLAGAASADEAAARLLAADLRVYRPFTLLALDLQGRQRALAWDGREAADLGAAPPLPLVSSGYDAAGAWAARRRLLTALEDALGERSSDLLLRFHRSHQPERGAYSPCMHRADAATVSLSWVRVGEEAVEFRYAPGPPCRTPLGGPLTLARRAAPVSAG
jgi:uncharacterized protein with NRDE domain